MGTIINVVSIIVGSILGTFLKKGISNKLQDSIFSILGISIIIVGFNGVLSNMVIIDGQSFTTSGELLLIISLTVGVVVGEYFKIDERLNNIGKMLENKYKIDGFAKSFITGSLVFCVGAMAIIGALNDGLLNDPSLLIIKSLLDGIVSIILSATMGIGVLFSFIPVGIYQGVITLLSSFLNPYLSDELIRLICMVGYTLVITIGTNFTFKTEIKTANLLPSLLIPIFYYFIINIF